MCLAIPGKIERISGDRPLARVATVDFTGVRKEISLAYVPDAKIGDYVIVHVGFALSVVNEEEAKRVFEFLDEMGELDELIADGQRPADLDARLAAEGAREQLGSPPWAIAA